MNTDDPLEDFPDGIRADSMIDADNANDGLVESTDPDDAQGRGDNAIAVKEVEGLSQGQIVWRRFVRHKGAMIGMSVVLLIAIFAFSAMGFGPVEGWWQYQDPLRTHSMLNNGHPTLTMPVWLGGEGFALGDHPFGQDNIGTDYFAAVMAGIKTSLVVMVVLGITVLIVGVAIGALAGYYRNKVDLWLMRLTDLIIVLPTIVIGAVLGRLLAVAPDKFGWTYETTQAIYRNMPVLLAIVLGLILWPSMARLVRGDFMTLRTREFVDSARVAGASDWRIITKHILPNAMGVIIVNLSLIMSQSVVLETALSFLGFGITAPNISLGRLISDNQGAFQTRPWLFWWPGLFIILIALCVNFIGDGLRDAFDPRGKRLPSKKEMLKASIKSSPTNTELDEAVAELIEDETDAPAGTPAETTVPGPQNATTANDARDNTQEGVEDNG
ncbi:MAG: ABC transporter permease [Propionibacteriaceae bacterium]|jgi:peptide/nickel transport system permease protein|nr:ABC transporter permease [Propionibacteriaceae bacterium]